MPIDDCPYSFVQLAGSVLPDKYVALKRSIERPILVKEFLGPKSATKKLLKTLDLESDFPGCYVFIESDNPFYVGISRGVVKRIVQHINSTSHFSASLVYRMAKGIHPHTMRRAEAMLDQEFFAKFKISQTRLASMSVAYVEIQNDLELYLFEAYAAMKLDTSDFNSFRTH